MGDFAEGLISAIAGGVKGGSEAMGGIYEEQRKNAARIETETQLEEARTPILERRAKMAAELSEQMRQKGKAADFAQEGENLPERIRREGLISSEKSKAETEAEKSKWNDPEYRKAQSAKESITNPDRAASLRGIQTELAQLQLSRAKEENKMTPAEVKMFDSLGKQADQINAAVTKAQAEGNFDLKSGQPLLDKLAALTEEQRKIIRPHLPTAKASAALDINKYKVGGDPIPSPAPTPAPTATTQKATMDNSIRGQSVQKSKAAQAEYEKRKSEEKIKKDAEEKAAKIAGKGYRATGIQ